MNLGLDAGLLVQFGSQQRAPGEMFVLTRAVADLAGDQHDLLLRQSGGREETADQQSSRRDREFHRGAACLARAPRATGLRLNRRSSLLLGPATGRADQPAPEVGVAVV